MKSATIAIVVTLIGSPGLAASPERVGVFYDNRCHNCHVIRDTDGTLLAGIDMAHVEKKGPNLYGVVGRPAGSVEDFKYSDLMIAARDAGLVWSEEELTKFLDDCTQYLRAYTGLKSGNSLMGGFLHDEQTRADLIEFIASFGPPN